MEANQPEQDNLPRSVKEQKYEMQKSMRDAARKRAMHIQKHNLAVKREARREVRRPGRDYSGLFRTLQTLIGSLEDKKQAIRDVIYEALRFKRRMMAQLLEDYIVELELNENRDGQPICHHCAILHDRSPHNCTSGRGRKIG